MATAREYEKSESLEAEGVKEQPAADPLPSQELSATDANSSKDAESSLYAPGELGKEEEGRVQSGVNDALRKEGEASEGESSAHEPREDMVDRIFHLVGINDDKQEKREQLLALTIGHPSVPIVVTEDDLELVITDPRVDPLTNKLTPQDRFLLSLWARNHKKARQREVVDKGSDSCSLL